MDRCSDPRFEPTDGPNAIWRGAERGAEYIAGAATTETRGAGSVLAERLRSPDRPTSAHSATATDRTTRRIDGESFLGRMAPTDDGSPARSGVHGSTVGTLRRH